MSSIITIEQIRNKNDLFRRTFNPLLGRVLLTRSVQNSENLPDIVKAVQNFNDFNSDNDPYREHDFGAVAIKGDRFFFKIDYYDENYEYYQVDGKRVLTIMRAEEY